MNLQRMLDEECIGCGCYDADFGCTMPSFDKVYACPIYDNSKELAEAIFCTIFDRQLEELSDVDKENIEKIIIEIRNLKEDSMLKTVLEAGFFYTRSWTGIDYLQTDSTGPECFYPFGR